MSIITYFARAQHLAGRNSYVGCMLKCPDSSYPSLFVRDSLDIIVKCAPDDVESPALNGLALRVLEIEGRQLELKRMSETTWKHDGVVEMYVSN